MAGIKSDKQRNLLVTFRFGGSQFTRSANTKDRKVADGVKARVEETIFRLSKGYVDLPVGSEAGEFIISGGTRTSKAQAVEAAPPVKALSLGGLFNLYDTHFPAGAKADTTIKMEAIHRVHLLRMIGAETAVEGLTNSDFQKYANRRSAEVHKGRPINPVTIRKELSTLRVISNWASKHGHLAGPLPYAAQDVSFARTSQKTGCDR